MDLIKKDGRVQEISILKIRNSILGASIDSKSIINESDLKIVDKRVMKRLEEIRGKNGVTSSYEVLGIIVETLKKYGFEKIAIEYLGFNK